jgi:two-component system, OmpR family, response regulator
MPRVLVVEDEARIASFVCRALTAAGVGVDYAEDGAKALELSRSREYALVVLDLLLPGVDGETVLRRILENDPEQRVLIVSALSDVDQKVKCLEIGASDYLSKPFEMPELLARVRARLRQLPPTTTDRYLKAGHVTLDTLRRVANSGAGPVTLSDREFALLRYLMELDGLAASRDRLLADLWGMSFDTGSNVVDVTVGRLRSRLGEDVILTVRNVGYRLNAS